MKSLTKKIIVIDNLRLTRSALTNYEASKKREKLRKDTTDGDFATLMGVKSHPGNYGKIYRGV